MAKIILEKVSHYQTIIWDWNGTLVNDAHIAAAAETELLVRYGLPTQTYEERAKNFCFPIELYYKKLGFDFSKQPYEKVANEWLQIYEGLIQKTGIFEGVEEMLLAVKNLGRKQFILSAAPEDHVRVMTSKHAIHGFFDGIYGLSDAKAESKIARGHDLMRDHSIDASSAILIGDTVHDFEVASALGIHALLVGDGHQPFEVLSEAHHNVIKTRRV